VCCGSWGRKELDTTERLNITKFHSFLRLSNIPLYVYITFFFFYITFFNPIIYQWTFVLFPPLGIINNVSVNIDVQVLVLVPLCTYFV